MEISELVIGRDYWVCRNPPNKPYRRRYMGYKEPTENTRGHLLFAKIGQDGAVRGVFETTDITDVIRPAEEG